jgi:hypothetical protein
MQSKQGTAQTGMHPTELQPQRDIIRQSRNNYSGYGQTNESSFFGQHQMVGANGSLD